jgi:xanthine/CO dehydrogenase XdhC/CoxF family maturation factor
MTLPPPSAASIVTDDAILGQAEVWLGEGRGVALATVANIWGSAPVPVGSHLAVEAGGSFVGSVSGGCVEGAVITEALAVIADGRCRSLDFKVTDERAWEVGLACGGTISIFVERIG